MTQEQKLKEIAEQLKELLSTYQLPDITIENKCVEFHFREYDDELFSFNFARLMKISEILGTTDFDLTNEKKDGQVYSEWTVDSDEYFTIIKVKLELLGGAPCDKP